ncbi:MAG: 2-oxoacid:ferredoxin oxidoreductase subunit beta, partial [Pseudomonadota bacterium]|nr:2-oxoacid:ferredoxin oxidoreductase subunit beta [Pseudomonadota bacterium]
ADHVVEAVHGEPLIFGAAHDKGLRMNPRTLSLEVVSLAADGGNADDILIHDETNRPLAGLLAALGGPDFPTVVGVIYRAPAATFETAVLDQVADRPSLDSAERDIHALLTGGATWRVGDEA